MRIGIDCRAFRTPSRYQGIGTYSSNLIRALSKAGPHHQWIPLFQSDRRSFLTQMRDRRLDLCHLLEFSPPYAATDRVVVTVYDLIPLIFPKVYLRWRHPRARRNMLSYYRFLRKVPRLIAISHQTESDLIRLLGIPGERITLIYPGVNPAFRPLQDRSQISSVLKRHRLPLPFVLYVGSCDYRKNVPGLFKAFAKFRSSSLEDYHLVLIGKEIQRREKQLRRHAESLGIGRFLRLVGYLPLEDLVCLYNAAALLAFPSLYEGFGFPPLEAMACGTPVVTSGNSALAEITGGCALQVDPRDTNALAEGMRRTALDPPLRRALIRNGLERAQQFSWSKAAKETLDCYHRISDSFGRGTGG